MGLFKKKKLFDDTCIGHPDYMRSVLTILGPYRLSFSVEENVATDGDVVHKGLTSEIQSAIEDQTKSELFDKLDDFLQAKIDAKIFKKWRLHRDVKLDFREGVEAVLLTPETGKEQVLDKVREAATIAKNNNSEYVYIHYSGAAVKGSGDWATGVEGQTIKITEVFETFQEVGYDRRIIIFSDSPYSGHLALKVYELDLEKYFYTLYHKKPKKCVMKL